MTDPDQIDPDQIDPYAAATAVAVAASSIPGEFLVPELADAFAAEHPEYTVDTVVTDSSGVFAALRDGSAEVGFAGVEPDGDDLDAPRSFTDALAARGTPLITDQRWTIRDTNEDVIDAVAAGEGVGVISSWALERHARDDVHVARVEGDPVERCLPRAAPRRRPRAGGERVRRARAGGDRLTGASPTPRSGPDREQPARSEARATRRANG